MSMFRWMSNPFFFPRQHKSPVRESVNSLALRQERVGKILGKGDEDGVPPAGGPCFLLRSRGFLRPLPKLGGPSRAFRSATGPRFRQGAVPAPPPAPEAPGVCHHSGDCDLTLELP